MPPRMENSLLFGSIHHSPEAGLWEWFTGVVLASPLEYEVYIQLCKANEITVSVKVALKHYLVGHERDEQDFAIRPYG